MNPLTIIYGLGTLVLGAWIGHKLTERREREKAERESARKIADREEAARIADAQLRDVIATDVTSARSLLEPLFHSVSPDRPVTPEQVERIERAASNFRRHDERRHELRDEDLRRQVHAWYQNFDRAPADLEHLSNPPEEFEWIQHEHLRKTKRGYALSRRQAAKRRLQTVLDDGADLELIGKV